MLHVAIGRLLQRHGPRGQLGGYAALLGLQHPGRRGLALSHRLDTHRRAWWPCQRQKVTRMGMPKTRLSKAEAQQLLAQHYCLRLRELWPLPRGTINSNYIVATDAGRLFLRVCEGKTEADARFEAELIWQLCCQGLQTPALWQTRSCAPYVMHRCQDGLSRPVMLMSFVPGIELTEAQIDEAHAFDVGLMLGQLHVCTQELSRRSSRHSIYSIAHLQQRLHRVQLDPKGTRDIRELTSRLLVELEVIQKLRSRNLPQGIGHGDLFPDNVLFPRKLPRINGTQRLKGPVGYVLDLEQAATMPLVYDVAVALLAFCAPVPLSDATSASHDADERNQPEERVGPLRVDVSRALLDGYQQLRVLADAEWQALPMELRLAAARFTTTRLTDIQGLGGLGERPATTELPPSTSGAMGAATNPTPDSAAPAPQPAEAGPPGLGLGPVHSKDYRDFAQRLALLQATSPEALITTLRDA